jgi:hypothetical protein
MPLIYLDRSMKGWLIGSILVLCINVIVFIFRSHLDKYVALAVVFFTPLAWALLYVLARLILRKAPKK